MREALDRVCHVAPGRGSMVSMTAINVEEVQYALKPALPDAVPVDDIEMPTGMSPRTALLAGLLLGVTVMIGVLGAIAWRGYSADALDGTHDATPSPSGAAPAVSPH